MAILTDATTEGAIVDAIAFEPQGVAWSVALWGRRITQQTNDYVWSIGNSGTDNSIFAVTIESGGIFNLRVFIRNSGNSIRINWVSTLTFISGSCMLIVVTQDASNNLALYKCVPGSAVAKETNSYTTAGTLGANRGAVGFLRRNVNGDPAEGAYSDFAVWNRQLSDSEVESLANGMRPSVLAPLHYYPLLDDSDPHPNIGSVGGAGSMLSDPVFERSKVPLGRSLLRMVA